MFPGTLKIIKNSHRQHCKNNSVFVNLKKSVFSNVAQGGYLPCFVAFNFICKITAMLKYSCYWKNILTRSFSLYSIVRLLYIHEINVRSNKNCSKNLHIRPCGSFQISDSNIKWPRSKFSWVFTQHSDESRILFILQLFSDILPTEMSISVIDAWAWINIVITSSFNKSLLSYQKCCFSSRIILSLSPRCAVYWRLKIVRIFIPKVPFLFVWFCYAYSITKFNLEDYHSSYTVFSLSGLNPKNLLKPIVHGAWYSYKAGNNYAKSSQNTAFWLSSDRMKLFLKKKHIKLFKKRKLNVNSDFRI